MNRAALPNLRAQGSGLLVWVGSSSTRGGHFDNSGHPSDIGRAAEHDAKYGTFMQEIRPKLAALAPADADVGVVAKETARLVALPAGQRPFRVHVDPNRNGSEVVAAVADRIRADFYPRLGIDDLLPRYASL